MLLDRLTAIRQRVVREMVPLGVILASLILVFWPALFESKILLPTDFFDSMTLPYSTAYQHPHADNAVLSDALMQSYPWKVLAQQALRSGHTYYWNPLILGGYPQYAASRQAYDVFNLLLLPFDLPLAFVLIIVSELLLAGAGMYLLLRTHGIDRWISLFFALSWMYSGMFLTHLLNLWPQASFSWLPITLAFLHLLIRDGWSKKRRTWTYLVLATLSLSLSFFGGTLQTAAYVLFTIAVITLFYLRAYRGRITARGVLPVICIIASAFLITAIYWLPTVELYLQVVLHGRLYSPTHDFHYSLLRRVESLILLLTFFLPETLGLGKALSPVSIAKLHPLDFSGFTGFLELALAVWAVFSLRRSDRSVQGYGWLIIFGFLLPILTPLFAWLYHRFFIVGTLGIVVLAAERLQRFLHEERTIEFRRWHKATLWLSAVLFAAVSLLNVVWLLAPSQFRTSTLHSLHSKGMLSAFAQGNEEWVAHRIQVTISNLSLLSSTMLVPFGVIALSLLVVWLYLRHRVSATYLIWSLTALAFLHSFFIWRQFLPMEDPSTYPLLPEHPQIAQLQREVGEDRLFISRELVPDKQYVFLDNQPECYGLRTLSGYESLIMRSLYVYVDSVDVQHHYAKYLGLGGSRYVMTAADWQDSNLRLVSRNGTNIYENRMARPRAIVQYAATTVSSDRDAVLRLMNERSNHDTLLLMADGSASPSNLLMRTTRSWDSASVIADSGNSLLIKATARQNGYLLVSDTYYPGWSCAVDGVPTPITRANYCMRAVPLTAGQHIIRFEFRPATFVAGAWISGVSLLAVVAIGAAGFRRRSAA